MECERRGDSSTSAEQPNTTGGLKHHPDLLPLTCYVGAEDGIRTRDPHLGKVFEIVHGVLAGLLNWLPVYRTSTESAGNQPCCRAVY